jgi:hypothetical protein
VDAARATALSLALLAPLVGCGGHASLPCEGAGCAAEAPLVDTASLPYARSVERFSPGPGAGFGADRLPGVVLGPPFAELEGGGALDVVSLGAGGEIVLGFGPDELLDGPGPDLVVFENPFLVNGDPDAPYAELGEVAVSTDAVSWRTFACDAAAPGPSGWSGCAGWRLTRFFDPVALVPLEPALTGGDPFDLAEVGLESARFVRIRDLSVSGEGQAAGFDLDAVGMVHHRPASP